MKKNLSTVLLLVLVTSCQGRDKAAEPAAGEVVAEMSGAGSGAGRREALAIADNPLGLAEQEESDGARMKVRDRSDVSAAAPVVMNEKAGLAANGAKNDAKKPAGPGGSGGESETAARSWFPETFLFEPLVVTDANGAATVPVRVPDRLTTWQVLALAHSREGAQGGAVTSFLGTLPTYVDLVVPKYLTIGDKVRLPVQMVNTTAVAATSPLALSAKNATLTGGGGGKTIPAQGATLDYATLEATKAGVIEVKAVLGSTDAVVRTIEVRPAGRPETVTRSGTLAAPRTLTIAGPAGSDPATDRVRLLVYPGALSLLRSELGVSTYRESVADDAYALLLAGQASELLARLGDKADPEAIRTLSILTGQRAIRDARALDVDRATLLVPAALAHAGNPVLARLGERAVAFLAKAQRPDGSFAGGSGWSLQRVLVATAEGTRAVAASHITASERQRAMGVTARAQGMFARTLAQVTDPYTAAAILASGGATTANHDTLAERVRAAIETAPDGAQYLAVPDGVVRADGAVPSRAEATALAVLALAGDPKAPLADLGATLLGSYSPDRGWSDGRANLVCMQAVLALFQDPVPAGVKITLFMDGAPVTEGTLDRAALKDVMALDVPAPGIAGEHEWKVVAEPAVPGLGYSLALRGYVPWEKQATQRGLEMAVTPGPVTAQVGVPVELAVSAIAPSGHAVTIVQALPAGVQPDTASLDALVTAGTLARYETAEGKVTLTVPALAPGQTFAAKYKVIPTLAGTLRSAPSTIEAAGTTYAVPPSSWTVR